MQSFSCTGDTPGDGGPCCFGNWCSILCWSFVPCCSSVCFLRPIGDSARSRSQKAPLNNNFSDPKNKHKQPASGAFSRATRFSKHRPDATGPNSSDHFGLRIQDTVTHDSSQSTHSTLSSV
ncbi:hypothetical protein NMG60_11028216 [Bertholletia excelsa]